MSAGHSEIRIVKKKKGHAGHHGGAWKVAYADFVTAMMAFFLVMWITGLSTELKESVAGYFKDPTGFMEAVKGGNAPFETTAPGEGEKSSEEQIAIDSKAAERERLKSAKETIEKMVAATPEFKDLKKHMDIRLVDEGLKIELLEDKENLFFDAASAVVKPNTRKLLKAFASELGTLPNSIIIEGHTDNRPLNRSDEYSNWELSADRANSARRIMMASGLAKDQVPQVRGYADTQPRDPEHPDHFSNRRVSIIVVMKETQESEGSEEPEKINADTFIGGSDDSSDISKPAGDDLSSFSKSR